MNFKTKKQRNRYESLVPNGIPKYIRCYDNGGASIDCYTVVMTGHYNKENSGGYWYLGRIIDRPSKHLGKKIKYEDLPREYQTFIMSTYLYLWDFTDDAGYTLK